MEKGPHYITTDIKYPLEWCLTAIKTHIPPWNDWGRQLKWRTIKFAILQRWQKLVLEKVANGFWCTGTSNLAEGPHLLEHSVPLNVLEERVPSTGQPTLLPAENSDSYWHLFQVRNRSDFTYYSLEWSGSSYDAVPTNSQIRLAKASYF